MASSDIRHGLTLTLAAMVHTRPITAEGCQDILDGLDQGVIVGCVPYSRGPGQELWAQWQRRSACIGVYLLVREVDLIEIGDKARHSWQARIVTVLTGDDAARFLGWSATGFGVIKVGWEDS